MLFISTIPSIPVCRQQGMLSFSNGVKVLQSGKGKPASGRNARRHSVTFEHIKSLKVTVVEARIEACLLILEARVYSCRNSSVEYPASLPAGRQGYERRHR